MTPDRRQLRFTLRPYAPDDFDEIVAVWRASKRAAFAYVEAQQRWTLEDDAGHFRRVISVEYEIWLAEAEGRIVGMLARKGDFVDQLFVHPDLQRCGVGPALCARRRARRGPARLFTFSGICRPGFYEKRLRAVKFGVSPPPENEPDGELGPPQRAGPAR
jgi:GNAT superfamily N-acetyltransferase